MLKTKAVFARKESSFEPQDCVIEKIIRLTDTEYDSFAANMLHDYDFIKDNVDLMGIDNNGTEHCLLVTGEGRQDGILVDSSGSSYGRYTSYMPNAADFLTMQEYPALAELNQRLISIVDYMAWDLPSLTDETLSIDMNELENQFGVNLQYNASLVSTVCGMLDSRSEIADYELDKNMFLVTYTKPEIEQTPEQTEPDITPEMTM